MDAPLDPTTFDYHDKQQLALMYTWAGSCHKLSSFLAEHGVKVAANTLNLWRTRHNIPTANESYRLRDAPPAPQEDEGESFRALREYLEGRVVPTAPGPTAAKVDGAYSTCLIGCDLHFPFHHEGAFELFLNLADRIQPEDLVLNGDTLDLAQIGKYDKDPNHFRPLQRDLDTCREQVFGRINAAAPNATKRFIVGNHEGPRMERYLWSRAPELASLRCLTMEALLGMAEMGWYWQPDEFWPTDALIVWHGSRHTNSLGGGSAQTARKEFLSMNVSGVTGHTHTAGQFYRHTRGGYYVWTEGGCLCDWRKMQKGGVTGRRQAVVREDWHLSCVLVTYKPGHSAFKVELIPIIDDKGETFVIWRDERLSVRSVC